jgi:sulfate transport system permease protein
MSSVAQVETRRGLRIPHRTAAVLRHLALRGAAIVYLGLLVVLPVIAVITKGFGEGLGAFTHAMDAPGAWAAIELTLWMAAVVGAVNAVVGTALAWVLVLRVSGRRALSTAVDLRWPSPRHVGVMIRCCKFNSVTAGSPTGWGSGPVHADRDLPRTVHRHAALVVATSAGPAGVGCCGGEEAGATLGASPRVSFRRVVFPAIRSAVAAGALLTFSRCLGEIGSVILVSGNRTGHTLTAPVFIFQLTGQFRFAEAAAVATLLFAISFVLVLATGRLLRRKETDG